MAKMQDKKNIAIVGGSLTGLMTGTILARLSPAHRIKILERIPQALLHNQGAGIVASGDVQTFFSRYDRTRTPIAVESPRRQYLGRGGDVIDKEDWTQRMTSWDLLYQLLRANFDGGGGDDGYVESPKRQEGDGRAEYRFGCKVLVVNDLGEEGVEVVFETSDGDGAKQERMTVDLLIGADGPSSTIRRLFCPEAERTYAGYVALRGTVAEALLSEEASKTLVEKFTFFHSEGTQVLCYLIPGEKSALEKGKRLMNWVWYRNARADEEKARFLTDAEGKEHNVTIPVGKMHPDVKRESAETARKVLPPQFAELVEKTEQPFVQAITDVVSPANAFMDDKVLLLGDAVAGFRPHTAASTGQAAFDAMLLGKMMEGKISLEDWQRQTMEYARDTQQRGVIMGERSQFGHHPLSR